MEMLAVRHRRLGRRRQVDPDRAAAPTTRKQIFEDQLEAVERTSRDKGFDYTNLALLTDGLRAEREQGITIDVAYRYFATPKRKFIIADTPGHIQYTRNMVTGASTADLALVLVDARKGVLEQTRRHAVIASLLRVSHLVVCVNKMDLVDYDEKVFEEIRDEFTEFAEKLEFTDLTFIPISALLGDNVVERSPNMPWYDGPTLLWHLENVYIGSDRNLIDPRFPVQYVIRPHVERVPRLPRATPARSPAVSSAPGDEVMVLPSGFTTTVASIDRSAARSTRPPRRCAVTMRLADEIDISRGDMICRPHNPPTVSQDIDAMVCWFNERPLVAAGARTPSSTRPAAARAHGAASLHYRLDVNTLHRDDARPAGSR